MLQSVSPGRMVTKEDIIGIVIGFGHYFVLQS